MPQLGVQGEGQEVSWRPNFYPIWGKGSAFSSNPNYKDTLSAKRCFKTSSNSEGEQRVQNKALWNILNSERDRKLQLPAEREKSPLGIYW